LMARAADRMPAATKSRAAAMCKRPSGLVRARAKKAAPHERKEAAMAKLHGLDLGMLVDQYSKAL